MPRRARTVSTTGIYHVMVRGLNKLPVFGQTREKTRILNLIREALSDFEVAIYAYCIMPNHFHLLIKADIQELSSFMAKILAAYAHYYNYKHDRIGYVFQDRYKSQCVEDETYFWNCLRYIHLNPQKEEDPSKILKNKHCSLAEIYFGRHDIIPEEGLNMIQKRFRTSDDFLFFHNFREKYVFLDIAEDLMRNYLWIAREILEELQNQIGVPKMEILEYIETRKRFERTLTDILHLSRQKILNIEQQVRKELIGAG